MSGATVTLRRATDSTVDYIETLLERNDLPTRDVRENSDSLYVAYDGADRVGAGGVEVHGADGLLRSVVVEQSARGDGVGTAICSALERRARDDGVERLYLLTTTAAGFFADRGYERVDRTDAPPAIRETTEFAVLCPASATCMAKRL